jgi:hypothetical protein
MPKVGRESCQVARGTNKQIMIAAKAGIEAFAAWVQLVDLRPGVREGVLHMLSLDNDGRLPRHLGRYSYFTPGTRGLRTPWPRSATARCYGP